MKKTMNILVIGNGFDLQHGLQTRYTDFLDFCESIKRVAEHKPVGNDYDVFRSFSVASSEEYDEFVKLIDSFWIRYFISNRPSHGDKWVLFETEIENVAKGLFNDKEIENKNGTSNGLISVKSYRKYPLRNVKTYAEAFKQLETDLKKLKRALDIYLSCYACVKTDSSRKMGLIESLRPDKLLSFNYTSTFFDYYCPKRDIDYEFIHGIVGCSSSADECKLVLGYDDHYNSEAVLDLVPFEKYYQRIVYRTGADYLRWLEECDGTGNSLRKTVHFYGHSMSPADGDILKTLICAPNTSTIIYYREGHEEERAEMIKNLAVVLTPEELIRRTGEHDGTIVFKRIEV